MRIYVEGNIGSGKSTLLRRLKNLVDENIDIIQEPVDEWIRSGMLDLFYKDMTRWSLSFQLNVLTSRLKCVEDSSDIAIIERSVYTDYNCFAKLLHENKTINDPEWDLYNEVFRRLTEKHDIEGDLYIYVRIPPEVCYQRIAKRDRKEESDISLEYLKQLHEKHEKWLMNLDNVIVFDEKTINSKGFNKKFKKILNERIACKPSLLSS